MSTSFDDEWAQIKKDVSVRMNLAHVMRDGGGGGGQLKTEKQHWTMAGEGVSDVGGNLGRAVTRLRDSQHGVGSGAAGVDGLVSAAAQDALLRSWQTRLDLIGRECGELRHKLEKAGDDHYKNDEAIAAAFEQQLTKPTQPPPPPPASPGERPGG